MVIFETVLAWILTLVLVNAALQIMLCVYWNLLQKPERPLLKPVILCGAAASVRTGAAESWRYLRHRSRDCQQIALP